MSVTLFNVSTNYNLTSSHYRSNVPKCIKCTAGKISSEQDEQLISTIFKCRYAGVRTNRHGVGLVGLIIKTSHCTAKLQIKARPTTFYEDTSMLCLDFLSKVKSISKSMSQF